jgi:hypothetical protein
MWDDEVHLGIFLSQQPHCRNLAHYIVKERQVKDRCCLTDCARDRGIMTMDFDPYEAQSHDSFMDQSKYPFLIEKWMDKGKAIESLWMSIHNPCHLTICLEIVGMEGSEQHRLLDASLRGSLQILAERRCRVPRTGQPIAFPGMTMTVDDHVVSWDRYLFDRLRFITDLTNKDVQMCEDP